MKIEHRGYTISQEDNCIIITKDNEMVFGTTAIKKLSKEELKMKIDWFIELLYKIGDE